MSLQNIYLLKPMELKSQDPQDLVAFEEMALTGPCSGIYPQQRPAQRQLSVLRLKVKEAHLHMLKHWPEEQASNLTYTSRSLLEYYPDRDWWVLSSCLPSAVLQRTSISWKKPLHASGAPMFAPRGYLLTAWLWRSRELVFLVPWNCNNWCHPEGSSYPSGTPICADAAREHLYHPALAASGVCAHGTHRIITNEKRVLQQLPPPLPPPPPHLRSDS